MAQTLSLFYVLGGTCGLVGVPGGDPDPARRWAIVALGSTAVVSGLALARWGAAAPRGFFHAPVAAATVLIAVAALMAPGEVTALVVGAIILFVGVDSFFFFALPGALAQLGLAVGLITAALLTRGDVPPTTALALDVVLVAIGVVTRRLVAEASRASTDGLTRLANRRGFDEALAELVRPGAVLSAALLDLDHFKQVNDTGGHAAGDEVLRQVARTWRRALPAGAVLARHGGDEFALLLPGWTGARALELVRRLRTLHPGIGMSCGVAQFRDRETAAQLMRRADQALYAAKAAGRGRAELAGGTRESVGG
ncbi:diguanylate cyclase (GGDEF) domain-containing protein [Klenkia taihuensis]|uniref:Diguanylate cyclase (GGDEF) domain-containing protein n=2 Tax=Klenkia taihuensis TaxID=1225127 RepID=A0A1I1PYJ0_9ACTN|nr:diguanylate cyclase (GGDEF) domain-containing protein [Klenkia taihuensis]